ncbi:MAG: hypothetical protein JXR14_07660 [Paracoccaceae bacterium]
MAQETDENAISGNDLVVILVGLTASWRKRRQARSYFRQRFGSRAYLPWIPYVFGLGASAAWLSYRLARRLSRGRHERCHIVAYIGGGVLLRMLHAQGKRWPIGRSVWDRGPIQEQVAGALTARIPGIFLTLGGLRAVVDLARSDFSDLPFPKSPLGAGLIVETRSSSMARWLGIKEDFSLVSNKSMRRLLPEATDTIALPLSHDEVYEDVRFLDAAADFLRTGRFEAPAQVGADG